MTPRRRRRSMTPRRRPPPDPHANALLRAAQIVDLIEARAPKADLRAAIIVGIAALSTCSCPECARTLADLGREARDDPTARPEARPA